MDFKRQTIKFASTGVQLSRPSDLLAEGKFAVLTNIRSYIEGTLQPRRGLTTPSNQFEAPVHSIKRFFDDSSNTVSEIVGGGTKLYMDGVLADSGYSGDPLSFVPHRPASSPATYIYIADSLKMRKITGGGIVSNMGIAPPNEPLTAALGAPSYRVIENFETLPNDWIIGGTAGVLTLLTGKRVDTTIEHILYDVGSTGWACVAPVELTSALQECSLVTIDGSEEVKIEQVCSAISSTTIESILYDSGSTGLCTIQPVGLTNNLKRDSFVRLGGSENVRVLDVVSGRDGISSFRCSTASTFSAGATVDGLASFRAFFNGTFSVGATITNEAFQSTIDTGIGHITKTVSLDLATVANRPIRPDDYLHVSLRMDVPDNVVEGKVMLDVDPSADFTGNYFYFPFRANDLTPAVSDTLTTLTTQQTTLQTTLVRDATLYPRFEPIEYPSSGGIVYRTEDGGLIYDYTGTVIEPPQTGGPLTHIDQTATGANQWTELKFRVGDLQRVGPDASKTLVNVTALRIQLNVTAPVVAAFDSFWIGGTYGLTSIIFPYVWTYRYRASVTGAVSNPAPPMRSGLSVIRNRAVLTPVPSADPQVDKIDYFRRGGTLPEWHYIGTGENSGTFTDTFRDEEVTGNFGLDEDNFQPFPIADLPRTGRCNVRGTEVEHLSGDLFNIRWARGSEIIIDGVPNSLYASPTSDNRLKLEESQGTLEDVTFFLRSPTLMAQPIATMWGPYSVGGAVFVFACREGFLYFTKGNDPDAAPEMNQIEVTSPNEPLVGGCIYDGQSFVWSTERMFRIIPTFQVTGAFFEVQELPVGKGLMTHWFLCVDETITFGARDGIYQTNGNELKNITDADLYPLFPHDGQDGSPVHSYLPPDYEGSLKSLRLAAGDGLIKFTAKDTGGVYRTWVFDTKNRGWISQDTYTPQIVCHYWDEGGSTGGGSIPTRERVGGVNGIVYTANKGFTDNGAQINSRITTRAVDFGETRAQKRFADLTIGHTGTIKVEPEFDNSIDLDSFSLTQSFGVRRLSTLDLGGGAGKEAVTMALNIYGEGDPDVVLYEWQPSFIVRPEDSKLRWTDFHNDGHSGAKFLQGMVLTADTGGVARTVQVQGDGGVVIATLTVNHQGYVTKAYPGAGDTWNPTITHLIRLVPSDPGQWRIFDVKWVWDPAPEQATKWQTQGTSHDFEDFHHLRRLWVALQSTSDVTLVTNIDGADLTYIIPSTGGVYKKLDVPLQARKGKIWTYTLTSAQPFRVFVRDLAGEAAAWNHEGPYRRVQPFGDVHRVSLPSGESLGARI